MCHFFSFCSDGNGRYLYFDWPLRKKVLSGELGTYNPDSHTSVADFHGFKRASEDALNKYEYNPLTKNLIVDQINVGDDSMAAQKWADALDFNAIVPALIIKPIVNPFTLPKVKRVTKKHKTLLAQWASVRDSVWASVWGSVGDSVWDSVGDSVWASVWGSVGDSVWDSVGDSVWASVRTSVRASVWASVRTSVRDSVRDSVWASVGAYVSSFFAIEYAPDLSSCVTLWELGVVPSFDGVTWRLHSGQNAEVVYETKERK